MPNKTRTIHSSVPPQPMLKERELAQRWCVSQRTLQRWRKEGYGPPWLTIGGNIRYRLSDIEHFETIHSSEDQS